MKLKTTMIIIASFLAVFLGAFIFGKVNLSIQFHKEVKQLFSQSSNTSRKTFHRQQLAELPEPVQRYFNHALKDGQLYIRYARITHDGFFRTDQKKDWVKILGEQYATTENPGFIWKGTTSQFTARDMYIGDTGRLIVSLFSLIKVVDGKGERYDQGELLRWLGESVLYPTNLLPGERLQWSPIDAQSAGLTFVYNGLSLFYIVTINDIGEITQLETKRYMGEENLEAWVIKLADYQERNAIVVPTTFEVLWRLEKGDFSYARFNLKRIEYDKPEAF